MQRVQFFVSGGKEDLATVDGKLDGEIKLLAGGTDQLDNDKHSQQPESTTVIYLGEKHTC